MPQVSRLKTMRRQPVQVVDFPTRKPSTNNLRELVDSPSKIFLIRASAYRIQIVGTFEHCSHTRMDNACLLKAAAHSDFFPGDKFFFSHAAMISSSKTVLFTTASMNQQSDKSRRSIHGSKRIDPTKPQNPNSREVPLAGLASDEQQIHPQLERKALTGTGKR